MSLHIAPLRPDDRDAWQRLATGYKTFYETSVDPQGYERTWARLLAGDGVHGLGAWLDGRLVGLAHYLFHTTTWTPGACYLEDLFVDPAVRRQGVARALIERVADIAREAGSARFYWSTHETNVTARRLYDQVARHRGFLRYDFALAAAR